MAKNWPEKPDFLRKKSLGGLIHTKHSQEAHGKVTECERQIALADVVIANKMDLITQNDMSDITNRIRSMNSTCTLHYTKYGEIDLDLILGIEAYNSADSMPPSTVPHHIPSSVSSVTLTNSNVVPRCELECNLETLLWAELYNDTRWVFICVCV